MCDLVSNHIGAQIIVSCMEQRIQKDIQCLLGRKSEDTPAYSCLLFDGPMSNGILEKDVTLQ